MGNNYSNINQSNINSYNNNNKNNKYNKIISNLLTPDGSSLREKNKDRSSILRISPSFHNEYSIITVPDTLKLDNNYISDNYGNDNNKDEENAKSNISKSSNNNDNSDMKDNNLLNILVNESYCLNLSPRNNNENDNSHQELDINKQQSVLLHDNFNKHEIVNDWYKTNKLIIDTITLSIQKDTMSPKKFNEFKDSISTTAEQNDDNEIDEFDINYTGLEDSIPTISTIKPQTLKLFKQTALVKSHIKDRIQKPDNYLLIDWVSNFT